MPQLETLPATTNLEAIFEVIRRDGGVIISDFISQEEVADFNNAANPLFPPSLEAQGKVEGAYFDENFVASNTDYIWGLLGKLPVHTCKIVQHPLWNAIMGEFLSGKTTGYIGKRFYENPTSYIINLTMSFRVSPGANAQVLHRDQSIHSIQAEKETLFTSMLGCLVAGTRATERNGATRVVPGSHLWGSDRVPEPSESAGAAMEPGSALFWLGSTYHGAGQNICEEGEKDSVRVLYGVFGCRDYYRQEENQFLAIPPDVQKTLPKDVLIRAGWGQGGGGAGFVASKSPYDLFFGENKTDKW
ncbi:PhyH-domain-containing protein [Meredithblackwellia eburnea MCA 4105]